MNKSCVVEYLKKGRAKGSGLFLLVQEVKELK